LLLLNVLEDRGVEPEELARLRQMLDEGSPRRGETK